MSDELQNQIASLLAGAQKAGESAVDFIIQQAPDVAQQIVAWYFWENVITSICFFIPLALILFFGVKVFRNSDFDDGTGFSKFMSSFVMVTAFFILGGYSSFKAKEAIKAHVAPKLVLIEYIRDFK